MLADPAVLGNVEPPAAELWFDPEFWRGRGELAETARGRGSAWFIASDERPWVLRHYRRGGFIARLSRDAYAWAGEERVRAFAEWRLLEVLYARGLPVPRPVAARYQRHGLWYRCDLITQRIADAEPLSTKLGAAPPLPESVWRGVGAALARLHRAGVDHADLNAQNILLGGGDSRVNSSSSNGGSGTSNVDVDRSGNVNSSSNVNVSVIDFDRGRLRAPGGWAAGNLQRLRRSLDKISRGLRVDGSDAQGPDAFSAQAWEWLLAGYRAAP
jgi:3-deoxy-D-manno-octulosonic acid kinase